MSSFLKLFKKKSHKKEKQQQNQEDESPTDNQKQVQHETSAKKEDQDPRLWCFHCDDIAKFVIMIHYCIGSPKKNTDNNTNSATNDNSENISDKNATTEHINIISLLEQHGFDGLWKLVSAEKEWTFSNYGWGTPDKEPNPVSVMFYRNEKDFQTNFIDCPDLNIASYDLLLYAKKHNLYYAEILHRFGRPHQGIQESTAISYSWKRKVIEVAMYSHEIARTKCKSPFMWLDIININQNSRDIGSELKIIPVVYSEAKFHTMISRGDLHRGWCFFEFVLRSNAMATTTEKFVKVAPQPDSEIILPEETPRETTFCEMEDATLESIDWFYDNNQMPHLQPLANHVREWSFKFEHSQFTVETDRGFVREKIIELFGNITSVEKILHQRFVKGLEELNDARTEGILSEFMEEDLDRALEDVKKLGIEAPDEVIIKCKKLLEIGKQCEGDYDKYLELAAKIE